MVFTERVNINEMVDVSIVISKNQRLKFKGKFVRKAAKNDYSEYGLKIASIDELNEDMLESLIFQLEQDAASVIFQHN